MSSTWHTESPDIGKQRCIVVPQHHPHSLGVRCAQVVATVHIQLQPQGTRRQVERVAVSVWRIELVVKIPVGTESRFEKNIIREKSKSQINQSTKPILIIGVVLSSVRKETTHHAKHTTIPCWYILIPAENTSLSISWTCSSSRTLSFLPLTGPALCDPFHSVSQQHTGRPVSRHLWQWVR